MDEILSKETELVWVFMPTCSQEGAMGAPAGIFTTLEDLKKWQEKTGLEGNAYQFPLGVSLTDFCEPIRGDASFIKKYSDKSSEKYKAGRDYLGLIPHEHFFDHGDILEQD